jgi:prepilin-type N-terminal cleavage/methylation domain-containing protein
VTGIDPFGIARRDRRAAFTLVELLIVVGIIGVLAAIAAPNFIEAQTRAKVSRTRADLRSLATALEAYRVDNNQYPRADLGMQLSRRLARLATPIAYISSTPTDPFFVESGAGLAGFEPDYVYCSGNVYFGNSAAYDRPEFLGSIYSLAGRGPDGDIFYGGYCMAHPVAQGNGAYYRGAYDPTNGVASAGDIIRLSSGSLGATP